jgi:hypothetical protein
MIGETSDMVRLENLRLKSEVDRLKDLVETAVQILRLFQAARGADGEERRMGMDEVAEKSWDFLEDLGRADLTVWEDEDDD